MDRLQIRVSAQALHVLEAILQHRFQARQRGLRLAQLGVRARHVVERGLLLAIRRAAYLPHSACVGLHPADDQNSSKYPFAVS